MFVRIPATKGSHLKYAENYNMLGSWKNLSSIWIEFFDFSLMKSSEAGDKYSNDNLSSCHSGYLKSNCILITHSMIFSIFIRIRKRQENNYWSETQQENIKICEKWVPAQNIFVRNEFFFEWKHWERIPNGTIKFYWFAFSGQE